MPGWRSGVPVEVGERPQARGPGGLQALGHGLDVAHDAQRVAPHELSDVGIGGDYDGTDTFPVGLEDVSGYPRLVAALLDRSWSDAEVAKLVRGNTLRVMRDVEAVARDLQTTRTPSLRTFAELDGAT